MRTIHKLLFILILLLFFCNCVYAGDNDTSHNYRIINDTVREINDDKVIALENGHFNTSFDDGSNGYCLEYGEQEASIGDIFYKVNTSYARNNFNDEKVGNYIKLFFVEYTDYALSDKVRTQHYIWHFTDDFNGWRLNYTIIDNIKKSNRVIPDFYEEDLGNGTVRCFEFNVLLSLYEHHQNYFTYKIFYRNVSMNNCTLEDVEDVMNSSELNINMELVEYYVIDIYVTHDFNRIIHDDDGNAMKIILNNKITGLNLYYSISILLSCIILLFGIRIFQKYKKIR